MLGTLGTGGMGVVLSAYDPVLERKVAIKQLRGERWAGAVTRGRVRLMTEAQAMAWLSQREWPWTAVLAMFLGAGERLLAAHRQRIVHRDFKPDNVMVDQDD